MRCLKDEFIKGTVFHIYNHSVAESNLFRETCDYFYYIKKFINNHEDSPNEIYAYCLMPNHFHFCIQQNTGYEVYKFFNRISTSYAMYYNRKYNRKGKLFAGKLQHKLVNSETQLISLCQYIHYNPVKAGIVEDLSQWPYSNYLEYAKLRTGCLYSEKLILKYPEIFDNYIQTLYDYEKGLGDRVFQRYG